MLDKSLVSRNTIIKLRLLQLRVCNLIMSIIFGACVLPQRERQRTRAQILIWRLINRGRWYKHSRSPSYAETSKGFAFVFTFQHAERSTAGGRTYCDYLLLLTFSQCSFQVNYTWNYNLKCCSGAAMGSLASGWSQWNKMFQLYRLLVEIISLGKHHLDGRD